MQKNKRDAFEQEFAQREYLETPFGIIETVDIRPKILKESIPILLAPGWGETLDLQKGCLKEIFNADRRVIALRHALVIKKTQKASTYPQSELQKAQTLLFLLKEKKIAHIDVISHSEGAINLAIAATLEPEFFRNLVLVTPAGLSGKDSQLRLVFGFFKHGARTRLTSLSKFIYLLKLLQKPRKKEVGFSERLRSWREEVAVMTSFDIHPLLIALRKKGIKIAVLAGERDVVFPLHHMKKHLEKGVQEYHISEEEKMQYGLDIFATKKGGHELYTNTHEIMQQVFRLLHELCSHKNTPD